MDFETFCKLCDWIAQETGLPGDTAAHYATEIDDTPETDADGNWTATVDGVAIPIRPKP